MGEMMIREIDDMQLAALKEAATRCGREPGALARDMISYQLAAGPRTAPGDLGLGEAVSDDDQARRTKLLDELRDIRAMTLEPLTSDSTLIIREFRDADW